MRFDIEIESAIALLTVAVEERNNNASDYVSSAVRELYKLGVSPKSARLLLAQMGVSELQARIDCN